MATTCPACGMKTVHDQRVVDPDGRDRGSQSVCSNCGHVTRDDVK